MKIPKALILLLAATFAFGALTPRQARAQVSVGFFYDNLSPYGEWVQDPDYGYCWHPTGVDENWAPYTDGYWAYTDAGWTWVSYEDYGGIVYHYGRWARIPGEGWVWVPGETWAPAWVSWRSGGDYVGWAPLPPEAHWHGGIGFGFGVDASFNIGPGFYSFVNVGDFGAPALGPVIVSRDRNVTIINNTTNITNITTNNSTVYTGGPNYREISARSTRPIPTLKLVRQTSPGEGGKLLAHQQGSQLMVFAPKVTAPAGGKLPPPPKVARTITGVKADNGWDVVKDPQQRQQLKAKFKTEAAAGGNSAKPVKPEDLKLNQLGSTKTAVAGEAATPKPAKTKKSKTLTTEELENAPAKEEPGVSTAEATPKHKSKKAKTPGTTEENSFGSGDETPAPRKHKKAATPGDEGTGLQPFMGSDSSEPKHTPKPKTSEYSEGAESHGHAAQSGTPGKKKKKKPAQEQGDQPIQ